MEDDRSGASVKPSLTVDRTAEVPAPPACAVDPDTECPVCAARGERIRMLPVKAHYQCPVCHYFDSCCM